MANKEQQNTISTAQLKITEIFYSIQGEGAFSGYPCSFIRLSGCNLSCTWCDTTYSHQEGELLSIEDVCNKVDAYNCNLVEITGGEPLLQDNVYPLLNSLNSMNKNILLETNGSVSLEKVPPYVHIIMDIKTPSSNSSSDMFIENIPFLKKSDEIKIVISDREDFNWTVKVCNDYKLLNLFTVPITLQPAFGILKENDLAEWILSSGYNFKLGVQLHKYIFGDQIRGV